MKFLVVATSKNNGADCYSVRPSHVYRYSFRDGFTKSGKPSKIPIPTIDDAYRYTGEEAITVLETLEESFGPGRMQSWLKDWRIIPAPD